MPFETEQDVLAWYQSQERILTPEFLNSIPWKDISNHELRSEFLPVLIYMRDVERFTTLYYEELMRTPTVKDPAIKFFIDRWSQEELLHGDLLNRFLEEAGYPSSDKWYEEAKSKIPWTYRVNSYVQPMITNVFGRDFTAVHMTWGAIQEYTTLNGYQRLWEKAGHPVLEYLLRAIAREEAQHSFFYWSVARIKLAQSEFRQKLTRYLVEKFWSPVGEGSKPTQDTNVVIRSLFTGEEGVRHFDQRVNRRIAELPGLEGLTRITDRIAEGALT